MKVMARRTEPNIESGSALLSVILLMATVTLLVTEMTERQFLDIRRTGNVIAQDQAYLYARAAEALAISALNEDFKSAKEEQKSQVDHLNEQWHQQVSFPLEGGRITAQLTDLQSRFNLNDLPGNHAKARERFVKLIKGLELEGEVDAETLLFSIIEWMDSDNQSQTGGAEELYYLGLEKPYRTGNQLLRSVSELRLIKGMTQEVVDGLLPYVAALPEGTPLNINTADVEVLTTYSEVDNVSAMIEGRGEEGYKTVDDAFKEGNKQEGNKQVKNKKGFTVVSEYFLLESRAEVGGRVARLRSILHRPVQLSAQNRIEVISRSRSRQFRVAAKKSAFEG